MSRHKSPTKRIFTSFNQGAGLEMGQIVTGGGWAAQNVTVVAFSVTV